jgi:ankyrin repeat protein
MRKVGTTATRCRPHAIEATPGYTEVVKLLLAKDTGINAQGRHYHNTLQAACYKGHLETVKELLDRGAGVNAEGREYGNALYAARESRVSDIMGLLIVKAAPSK